MKDNDTKSMGTQHPQTRKETLKANTSLTKTHHASSTTTYKDNAQDENPYLSILSQTVISRLDEVVERLLHEDQNQNRLWNSFDCVVKLITSLFVFLILM